jgi:hypothetical protein
MVNQLNYLVAHHFTGLTTTFLRRRPMKSVRNLVFALLLAFTVTANVSAGEIPIPPAPEPSPRATVTTIDGATQPSLDPNSGETAETSDDLLFEALAALLYLY